LVTVRRFNLYAELLSLLDRSDPAIGQVPLPTYAATCRWLKTEKRFDSWFWPLVVGQPLPMLPIWLTETFCVSLDLEASYEEACRALRIA
jgi:hypothetical protein